ncbi:RTA1 like protein-domain-containing protein [Hypoxylon rubiginosum]|uniref:RTA1 like protein-domain-containing protein n=1 Tax=Hypoxylon rubiginosum TaxID=110542 RepID=A0ACB9YMU5_9PEZI|nr:RTA1 like protein-domain-containing protein [Hypoxylon rubiginosum]
MSSALCNPDWQSSPYAFYRYVPSTPAAVIFCLLFLISALLHFWQMFRTRSWFLGALVAGCFTEFVGYAARAKSSNEEPGCWKMMPYIIQNVFILLSPALFSASVYVILGKIVEVTDGDSHVLIKRRKITKTFVIGDLVCLFLQCASGGLMGGSRAVPALYNIGNGLVIATLILQLLWFLFFVVVAVMFHRSMRMVPTLTAQRPDIRWQNYLITLYVVSILVMIRSLFRAIEYIEGRTGSLQSTEVFFYIFDSLLMFMAVVYLHWKHPSEIGSLLRGEQPVTNGLKLITMKPEPGLFRRFQPKWKPTSNVSEV